MTGRPFRRNVSQFMRRRNMVLLTGAIIGCGMCVAALWHKMDNTWGFHRALPTTAMDVHEAFTQPEETGDYEYCLKASVTPAEFAAYANHFRLTPHAATRVYAQSPEAWLTWSCVSTKPGDTWWDPSPGLDETLVWQEHDEWILAKYEHGTLYLHAIDH